MPHRDSALADHAWDLPVYRMMLDACFQTLSTLIPALPPDAEAHLVAGLSRSCQRVPDLISLGIATQRGRRRFPYLDLAVRECHDMIQRLRYCEHTYADLDRAVSGRLLELYERAVKDLRRLTTQNATTDRTPEPALPSRPAPRMAAQMTLGMQHV